MPFYPAAILGYYNYRKSVDNINDWETPNLSYNSFVTGLNTFYDEGYIYEKFYSDYITRYYGEYITGGTSGGVYVTGGTANESSSTLTFMNSSGTSFTVANSALLFNDAYVSGGTLNPVTGVVTFSNTSGGTFPVSGFSGFTSYWSANTDGSISNSGLTGHVGVGTNTPNKPLTVVGGISGTSTLFVQSISTSGGIVTGSDGNSTQWNSAYNNTINNFTDSGTDTITLTLTQVDGGTLTTNFSNP